MSAALEMFVGRNRKSVQYESRDSEAGVSSLTLQGPADELTHVDNRAEGALIGENQASRPASSAMGRESASLPTTTKSSPT